MTSSIVTVKELVDEYLSSRYSNCKAKQTTYAKQTIHRNFADWYWRPASELTTQECQQRFHQILGERSVSAANTAVRTIKTVFNRAVENGMLEHNPWQRVELVPLRREAPQLTDEVRDRLFALLSDESYNQDTRDFIFISLFTGEPRLVVLGMLWADLDLSKGTWRGDPLHPLCAERLRQRRNSENQSRYMLRDRSEWIKKNAEYVFPSPVKEGPLVEIKTGYRRLLDDLAVPGVKMTDLQWFFYFKFDLKHTRHWRAAVGGQSIWRELEVRREMAVRKDPLEVYRT